MNSSSKNAVAAGVVLLQLTGFLSAAVTVEDPLWRKAVAVAAANADWKPGLSITRSEILRKGESKAIIEIWQRSKPGPAGEVITETVKVLQDGKDITQKHAQEKNDAKKPGGEAAGNPFDPNL